MSPLVSSCVCVCVRALCRESADAVVDMSVELLGPAVEALCSADSERPAGGRRTRAAGVAALRRRQQPQLQQQQQDLLVRCCLLVFLHNITSTNAL